MDQYKTDPAQRPQTLLEAAKAIDSFFGTASLYACSDLVQNLRTAIAREEAQPTTLSGWRSIVKTAEDRAQQAEADAAWHKAESARLSAELAKERERADGMERAGQEQSRRADTNQADMIEWRERAEKAEAELAKLIGMKVNPVVFAPEPPKVEMQTHAFGSNAVGGEPQQDDDDEDPVDPQTGWTFATYRRVVEALGGKS